MLQSILCVNPNSTLLHFSYVFNPKFPLFIDIEEKAYFHSNKYFERKIFLSNLKCAFKYIFTPKGSLVANGRVNYLNVRFLTY